MEDWAFKSHYRMQDWAKLRSCLRGWAPKLCATSGASHMSEAADQALRDEAYDEGHRETVSMSHKRKRSPSPSTRPSPVPKARPPQPKAPRIMQPTSKKMSKPIEGAPPSASGSRGVSSQGGASSSSSAGSWGVSSRGDASSSSAGCRSVSGSRGVHGSRSVDDGNCPQHHVPRSRCFSIGDWACGHCGQHNLAKRSTCTNYKCKREKLDLNDIVESSFPCVEERWSSTWCTSCRMLKEDCYKPFDWTCPACDNHNFARKQASHQK